MRTTVTLDPPVDASVLLNTVDSSSVHHRRAKAWLDGALALQHNAIVVTVDNDVGRFPGVRWESPPAVGR